MAAAAPCRDQLGVTDLALEAGGLEVGGDGPVEGMVKLRGGVREFLARPGSDDDHVGGRVAGRDGGVLEGCQSFPFPNCPKVALVSAVRICCSGRVGPRGPDAEQSNFPSSLTLRALPQIREHHIWGCYKPVRHRM